MVSQFRTQSNIAKALQVQAPMNQAQVISNLLESNASLEQEVRTLEEQLRKYQEAWDKSGLEAMVAEMNRLKVVNGLVEVTGPGIEVLVDGEIRVEEMQDIVNELRNAGAEALALGGRRLVFNSVIAGGEEGLTLNGEPLPRPYLLQAIGDGETIQHALERKGGMIPLLRFNHPGLRIYVSKVDSLRLPVYQGSYVFRFASPAE
jgi:uncharacterized protein YlxW (UPF0749 family)